MVSCYIFAPTAEWEAQEVELFLCCGEEEIALVFSVIMCAFQMCLAVFINGALDIVPCGHAIGAKVVGDFQEVAEFYRLIAFYAWDRGFAADIAVCEIIHDAFTEIAFVIEDVMREIELFGDAFGVIDILPCAACFAFDGLGAGGGCIAVIVEL